MRPTLLEGDVVLINRLAYDIKLPLTNRVLLPLNTPERGDVIVFHSPKDGTRLIKRVVALGGDRVQMRGGVLWVNEQAARYEALHEVLEPVQPGLTLEALRAIESHDGRTRNVQFLPQIQALRDFGPLRVPEDHVFVLGDNRDNSQDSRYIGAVPRHLINGRAHHVLVSADILERWWPRPARFGMAIE
jgi:signal peptidase I